LRGAPKGFSTAGGWYRILWNRGDSAQDLSWNDTEDYSVDYTDNLLAMTRGVPSYLQGDALCGGLVRDLYNGSFHLNNTDTSK